MIPFILFLLSFDLKSPVYWEKPFQSTNKVLAGTIYFSHGSFTVSSEMNKQITGIIQSTDYLRYYEVNTIIKIIGFTDSKGESALNLNLGMLRAESVATRLHEKGIPSEKIIIASYGENRSYTDDAENRKAEVWLVSGESTFFSTRNYLYFLFAFIFFIFVLAFIKKKN